MHVLRRPGLFTSGVRRRLPTRPCQAALSTASSSSNSSLLALVQWALKEKVLFSKIRPEAKLSSRGVYATFDVAAGDVLVSVPRTAAFVTSPMDSPPPAVPEDVWRSCPWYIKLALKLQYEKSQGSASRFEPYIKVLPEDVDLPVLWDDQELEQLQYPYLQEQVRKEKQEYQAWYQKLQPVLSSWGATQKGFERNITCIRSRTFASPYTLTSISDKLRAFAAAQAAVAIQSLLHFGSPMIGEVAAIAALAALVVWEQQQAGSSQQHAMCPLIDMFNHSSSSKSECEFSVFNNEYRVVATEPQRAGGEVCINYGSRSNDALLQQYGFVEADNAGDRFVVVDLERALQQAGVKVAAGALPESLRQVPVTRGGFPEEAVAAVRSLMGAAGSAQGGVNEVLAKALQSELDGLPTSLEDDLRQLEEHAALVQWQQQQEALKQLWEKQQELLRQGQEEGEGEGEGEGQGLTTTGRCADGSDALNEECRVSYSDDGVGEWGSDDAEVESEWGNAEPAPAGKVLAAREKLAVEFRVEKKKVVVDCLNSLGVKAGRKGELAYA